MFAGLMGEGYGILNSMMQQQNTENLMSSQEGYLLSNMFRAPGIQKAGMTAAGFNPMLMAGPQSPFSATPAQGMGANPGMGNNMALQGAQMKQATASANAAQADADLKNSQNLDKAGTVVPMQKDGTVDWEAYFTGPYNGRAAMMNAFQMKTQIEQGQELTQLTRQQIGQSVSQENLNNAMANLQGFNRQLLTAQYSALIRQAYADAGIAEAELTPDQAEAKLMQGPMGVTLKALQTILGIAGQGMGIATGGRALMNPVPRAGGIQIFNRGSSYSPGGGQ